MPCLTCKTGGSSETAGVCSTIGLAPNGISWIGKVLIVSTGNRVYTGTGLIAYLNFAAWL